MGAWRLSLLFAMAGGRWGTLAFNALLLNEVFDFNTLLVDRTLHATIEWR